MPVLPHDVADLGAGRAGPPAGRLRRARDAGARPAARAVRRGAAARRRARRGLRARHAGDRGAGPDAASPAGPSCTSPRRNPLSTQDDVAAALVAATASACTRGTASTGPGTPPTCAAVLDARPHAAARRRLRPGAACCTPSRTDLLAGVRAGGEQTSTGVLRLRQMAADGALRLPMVAVNDTPMQLLVANRHGTGQSTLDAVMRATGTLLAGTTVVVAGYGWCGSGHRRPGAGARRAGRRDRGRARGGRSRRCSTATACCRWPRPRALGDVFVTTTGNRDVLTAEHFAVMRDGAVLANAGHFDVEVDVVGAGRRGRRGAPAGAPARRRVRAARRPPAAAASPRGGWSTSPPPRATRPSVMDISFAVQALTVEWLAGADLAPGVHEVPAGDRRRGRPDQARRARACGSTR